MSAVMSAVIDAEVAPKTDATSSDMLKSILLHINDQVAGLKGVMNVIRSVLKDTDRQSKELEKLRNKRSRIKTERSANALPSGITKPVAITDELAKFLGVPPGTLVPRNEVTKGVSAYVKANDIADPSNKQKFVLDDRPQAKLLKTLLNNPTEDVTYFNLQRYLKHHYIHDPESKPSKKAVAAVVAETAPVAEPVAPVTVKKKIMVVKKKVSELTEES
jgi:chromatin remodeling complex protein RSC6